MTSALSELGKPYIFGASGPGAFDCSGLMVAAWSAGGHALSRTTYSQIHDGSVTTEAGRSVAHLAVIPCAALVDALLGQNRCTWLPAPPLPDDHAAIVKALRTNSGDGNRPL